MAGLWARVTGRGAAGDDLASQLKKATDSKLVDIPEELLNPIVEATHTEEGRQLIMRHLQECLSEKKVASWTRIHGAFIVIEELLKRGSPVLISETAEGFHFDLVQRISFLEHFVNTCDRRSQHLVRTKAVALRTEVINRLRDADALETVKNDNESNGSMASASTATSGVALTQQAPKSQVWINGIVATGHCDDTTSESSGGEGRKPMQARKERQPTRKTARQRAAKSAGDSSDSDAAPQQLASQPASQPAPPSFAAATDVDLLGL